MLLQDNSYLVLVGYLEVACKEFSAGELGVFTNEEFVGDMLASAASASGSGGGIYLEIALVTNFNLLKVMILPMGHLELFK